MLWYFVILLLNTGRGTYTPAGRVPHCHWNASKEGITVHRRRPYCDAESCSSFPAVKILGQIGLHYHVEPSRWASQHVLLDKVLKHLQPSHVLVLHARANQGDQTGVGHIQLLFQLKGVVPPDQKIHLHCFEGTTDMINRWTEEFPNTYLASLDWWEASTQQAVGSFNTMSSGKLQHNEQWEASTQRAVGSFNTMSSGKFNITSSGKLQHNE